MATFFVRRKPCWPDEMQKSSTLSGQIAIHRTNSTKEAGDGKNLTKGFQPYIEPAPTEARST